MPAASIELKRFITAEPSAASRRPGLLARFVQSYQETRLRQAEREVAKYIEGRGGRMTDDLERRIERRFI